MNDYDDMQEGSCYTAEKTSYPGIITRSVGLTKIENGFLVSLNAYGHSDYWKNFNKSVYVATADDIGQVVSEFFATA